MAISWVCPYPLPGAQQLSLRVEREAGRMGLGSYMQAGCPPTQVPSSQRPGPWATLAQPGTAQPATPCRCFGTAHRQLATVRHAALPLGLSGQPAMLLASDPVGLEQQDLQPPRPPGVPAVK